MPAPESFLGLDAPGAGRLDAKWPNWMRIWASEAESKS